MPETPKMTPDYLWQCFDSAAQVANAATSMILTAAEQAISKHGKFKLVLAGGTTPEKIYSQLAQSDTDWSKWFIYYGDERCLPMDHPDRNSIMASKTWLDQVSIPATQLFTIPAELGPEAAADLYRQPVSDALPFDLVLLGMGEDGHTASLFPGHVHDLFSLTHAVYQSPKPPPERVSLSAHALSQSDQIIFLVTGANKQVAVSQWKSGIDLPVATIQNANITILIDQEANGD